MLRNYLIAEQVVPEKIKKSLKVKNISSHGRYQQWYYQGLSTMF
jgi:hypothetical protein